VRVEEAQITDPPDLIGGRVCLDLVNTRQTLSAAEMRERLAKYEDLIEWSQRLQIVTRSEAADLHRQAQADPAAADGAMQRAHDLRAVLRDVFGAVADGSAPAAEPMAALNAAIQEAQGSVRLVPRDDRYEWEWVEDDDLARLLWPVARSAAELLASDQLQRVRLCAADTCRWLFVDGSKSGRRRWCDMRVCGNRAKAKRHYARARAEATPEPT
jgi:predicted RNA-binding Zn ribbon-like protein